jgi:cell division initiation protein
VKLTPLDIRHKDFKRGMRGYVDGEVDEFLDEVADEFERLFKENIELSERLDGLQEKINQYRNLEETLQNTLVAAQRSAEELKANAQKEAQLILSEAELKARQMVNDSYADKQGIEKQIVVLKSSEEDFRFKFRSLLEGYLKNLAEIEKAAKSGAGPADAERIKQAMASDQAKHAAAPDGTAAKPPFVPAQPAAGATSPAPSPAPNAAEAPRPVGAPAAVHSAPAAEPRPVSPVPAHAADEARPSSRDEADDLLADVEDGVDDNEFKW